MSIELKQAAQQALDAFEAFGEADDFATLFTLTQKMNALRTAIQQAEAKTDEPVYQIRKAFSQDAEWVWRDATEELFHMHPKENRRILYTHPAPGVPGALKDHQIAALVNKVRDIARMFHGHQSLRERIAIELVPALKVSQEVKRNAERYRWLRRKACVIGKTTYCGEETGQPILDFVNLPDVTEVIRRDPASTLDAAIDAAMLAAQAQKGGG